MEWNNDKVLALIKEFEARPVLWNIYNSSYKNRFKKQEAIDELVPLFGCRETEIYRKWKIILAQYRRERNRVKTTKDFVPKWFGYQHLGFLSAMRGDDMTSDPLTIDDIKNDNDNEHASGSSDDNSPVKKMNLTKRIKSKKMRHSDSSVMSVMQNINRRLENHAKRDDVDIFVEGVKAKLQKIKDENLRLMVQRDIDNLLYDALIGSGHYSTTTITYTT